MHHQRVKKQKTGIEIGIEPQQKQVGKKQFGLKNHLKGGKTEMTRGYVGEKLFA